ncbi:MAG: hypothetical protein ABI876_11165, partial [Bacteroidota bacterium]
PLANQCERCHKHEVLTEKIRQASQSQESVFQDTQAIIAQNSNRENVKPIVPSLNDRVIVEPIEPFRHSKSYAGARALRA